jgi:hypothetical protein
MRDVKRMTDLYIRHNCGCNDKGVSRPAFEKCREGMGPVSVVRGMHALQQGSAAGGCLGAIVNALLSIQEL